MPMHRWIARAAGGTSQRLNLGPAIVRSRARNPAAVLPAMYFPLPVSGTAPDCILGRFSRGATLRWSYGGKVTAKAERSRRRHSPGGASKARRKRRGKGGRAAGGRE